MSTATKSLDLKNNALYIISLSCILYALIVVEWDYMEEGNHFGLPVLSIGYLLSILAFITSGKKYWTPILSVAVIYLFVVTLSIFFSISEISFIEDFIKNTAWCIIFVMAYQWGALNINFKPVINLVCYVVLPVLYVMYLLILSRTFFIGEEYGFRDAIIPIAVLSAFPLFLTNKKVKTIHIIIILFLCLLSAKRSVILGVEFGAVLYFLKNYRASSNKLRIILIILITFLIGNAAIYYFDFNTNLFNIAFNRFDEMLNGNSSGRDDIAEKVLAAYDNSDTSLKIFGHGSHSTVHFIGKLTHNDFLQVLYDYGFIALLIFTILYIKLLIVGFKSFSNKHFPKEFAPIYCYTIGLFVFLGMFNCFISSPQTFTLIMFVFGYLIGRYKQIDLFKNHG